MEKLTAYKMVRRAGITGMVITGLGVMALLWSAPHIENSLQEDIILKGLLNSLIFFGLTYGIFKYNRICAIGLLVYFFIVYCTNIIRLYITSGPETYLHILALLSVIVIYILIQGVRGTFALHEAENIKTKEAL